MLRLLSSIVTLLFACSLFAENADDLEVLVDAPPPPEAIESGETLEPEITIIQKEDTTVEEYRVNGNLYMIKITPKLGKPYYIVDQDGDGTMDTNMSEIYSDFVVPQWVIFSW